MVFVYMVIYNQGLRLIYFDTRILAGVLTRRYFFRVCSGKPLKTGDTPHLAFPPVMRLFQTFVEVILCNIHNVYIYGYLPARIKADF